MPKKKRIIILLEVIFLLFLMNVSLVNGPTQKDVILSRKSMDEITVDGVLDPHEWINGTNYKVKLYDILDQTNTKEIWVKSVFYHDKLFIGITLEDIDPTNDFIAIIFRNNETSPMIIEISGLFWFFYGHDYKGLYIDSNTAQDAYLNYEGIGYENDTKVGGTNDLIAMSHINSTFTTCEFEMPLDSGDTNGFDFKLDLGDSIDIIFYYREVESLAVYSQLREDDGDFDYNVLKIIDPDAFYIDISIGNYIIMISSCVIVIVIIRKKRKVM
ncbi:MAG: hypothetical protein FK733_13950 [Asgard group archaeon]|nr:hypothetical protein [Asgard group archaeon]